MGHLDDLRLSRLDRDSRPPQIPPAPPAAGMARRLQANASRQPAGNPPIVTIWGQVWRHRWIVLLSAVAATAAAYAIAKSRTPVYQAVTSLEIQALNQNFMREVNPLGGADTYESDLQTQAKILRSHTLSRRAAARLTTYSPASVLQAAQTLKVRVSERTRIVEVQSESENPRLAADFVNTVASEFVKLGMEARGTTSRTTSAWLNDQLQELRARLEASERQLQQYASSSDLVITSDKGDIAEEKLRQVQQQLSAAQADLVTRRSRFEMAKSSPIESLPEVLDSMILRDYRARLTDLKRQLAELQSQFTSGYYKVQRVQAQIAEVQSAFDAERTNILNRIHNEYDDAARREKLLSAAYNAQARHVSAQAVKAIRYDMLKHDVDVNRQLYEGMLQKVRETGIAAALQSSNIRVVDTAEVPETPFKPDLVQHLIIGLMAGLSLGVGLAALRSRDNDKICEPGETARLLNVPELGAIFSADPSLTARLLTMKRAGDGKYALLPGPDAGRQPKQDVAASLLAESFRTTITSLLLADGDHQVIVIASPVPMDGKTSVVANLGIGLAAMNRKVLLIDADVRKPTLHKIFGLVNSAGWADLLESEIDIRVPPAGVPQPTRYPGLYVLPAGRCTQGLDSLYRAHIAERMLRFRRDFDMVLIDTPAMLHISDARILGRVADGVVIVVRSNFTQREAVQVIRERFLQDGTAVLGTILNDWNPSKSFHGYYRPDTFYRYYSGGE